MNLRHQYRSHARVQLPMSTSLLPYGIGVRVPPNRWCSFLKLEWSIHALLRQFISEKKKRVRFIRTLDKKSYEELAILFQCLFYCRL